MAWLLYLALISNRILAHSVSEPPAYQALSEDSDLLSFSLSSSWIVPASDPSVILEHTSLKTSEGVEDLDSSKTLTARRVWKTRSPLHGSTLAARGDDGTRTPVPDISDRQTLTTLAKATNEAYYPIPRDRADWRPAYNRVSTAQSSNPSNSQPNDFIVRTFWLAVRGRRLERSCILDL